MFLLCAFALLHPLLAAFLFFAVIHAKASLVALLAALGSLAFGMASTPNVKHTWATSIKNDSGAAVVADPPLVITFDYEINFCEVVPAGEAKEIDVAIDVSKIQSAFMTSSQPAQISTNAADGTGGQQITLDPTATPKVPSVFWHVGMTVANPFTPDITKLYLKNNGAVAATIRGGFGMSA